MSSRQIGYAGDALVFVAIVCEALFILLNRKLRTAVAPLRLSALMCGIGFAVALVPACFERSRASPASAYALGGVLYYELVPVSAVALAAATLGEPVSGAQLAGVACVLGAVLLAASARTRARRSAA